MVKGSADDWIALLIFGFFAFGAITRAFRLNQVNNRLKYKPTPEECAAVVGEIYRVDYAGYYNARTVSSAEAMLPPQPPHFKGFQVFSLLIAVVCGLLGLFYLIMSIILMAVNKGPEAISGGIMYFLYGSLATYFGIKDSADCIAYFRRESKKKKR